MRYYNIVFEREMMFEDMWNGVEERIFCFKILNVKCKRVDDLECMIERSNVNNVIVFEDWVFKNCEDDWKDLYVLLSIL